LTVIDTISPGVHRLGSPLVNWYLVEDGGRLTAVDAGLPGFAGDLDADLRRIGKRPEDVEAVVLTHSDSDHTGVASVLKDAGARVFIHEDDDQTLRKPGPKGGDASPLHMLRLMWRPAFWRFFGGMTRGGGARATKIEGAETYRDGDVLDVPGRPRAVHVPGHTPGQSALHFAAPGALFAGDSLCTWNPLSGERRPQLMPGPFNESNADSRRSLDALERVDAELVLPGHGEPWREGAPEAARIAREALRA